MSLPAPWNAVEESIAQSQDYAAGSERLADFFKGTEERLGADALFRTLLDAHPSPKWLERFAFSLFHTGAWDRQTGLRALEAHRVRRLLRKFRRGSLLEEGEQRIARELIEYFEAWKVDIEGFAQRCRDAFETLVKREPLDPAEAKASAFLIRSEAEALQQRVNWLSENVDPYNMKTMARILPRLRVYDEAVHEALHLSDAINTGTPIGENKLSLENHLKADGFNKWMKTLGKLELLRPWMLALELQREKRIPTMDLIALTTLSRYVFEVRGQKQEPITWILLALKSWQDGSFSLEAGDSAGLLRPSLQPLGLKVPGSKIEGSFHKRMYVALIGKDLLTRPYAQFAEEGGLDIKSLLVQNMGRDSVLEALLNNPKVFQTPGLVAFVATMSRSSHLLSKIAKTRALYSGYANRDVPMALLLNPMNIPLTLLRGFINTRYVAMVDLRHLVKMRGGIRTEVRREVEEYLLKNS